MTERNQQLELVRAKCIEANPEIATRVMDYTNDRGGTDWVQDCTIRLADVVLVLSALPREKIESVTGMTKYQTLGVIGSFLELYNLRQDDITQQSERCINFAYNLLK